ncbi:PepSY-like domain-containing protein [Parapedobacter sp. 10938]|uniref:PepSY-like domain-containing protein n=1 Tax=Parapedobacter flavus TaxID=3110225 RepID=UPI002DB6B0F8|nr:PepSY-like domain-containing protein [Parapedobacter sp. 10938]MEC3878097.1 PepSY-like domain-containing protein [Parapedobacter sp. 10938]
MKKVIYSVVSVAVMLMAFTACDKESVIAADGLPKDAQLFISQHFPDHDIIQVVKERDDLKTSYDVYLSDGFNLDFDKKGNIISVEGASKLPDSVVPEKILAYVQANYPDYFIRDWELDDRGQEVTLSNGMDLKFDKDGNFLRID